MALKCSSYVILIEGFILLRFTLGLEVLVHVGYLPTPTS